MTKLLQEAFEKANTLPREEQDRFAQFLLAELDTERRWTELFSFPESEAMLERLTDDALSAHRSGRTKPLDVDDL